MGAEQDLKQRWAGAMAAPRSAHLSEDVWEQLASSELPGPARATAFEHVSECAQCATTYRALEQLRQGAQAFDPGVPRAGSASRGPVWGWMGVAAAVLLAALVGLNTRRPTPEQPPQPSPTDGLRSGDASVPLPQAPRGQLNERPALFRWVGAAGLSTYHVELLSSAGKTLWSSAEVPGLSVAWPSELQVEPGRYYWHVVGKPHAASPLADAVVSPLVQIDLVPAGPR